MKASQAATSTLAYLWAATVYTVLSVMVLGLLYPLVMTPVAQLLFPRQAGGSMMYLNGQPIASDIIGQLWTKPQYFHGRPSAAGNNGYDPTSTGGTNLAPTSKKLIDSTRSAIAELIKDNPQGWGALPMDLVTSSASGIDPDITPEAADYQAPRIAQARHLALEAVRSLIAQHVHGRQLGIFGEPHVNVLELNLALDGKTAQQR
jgi:K+-transporting ATPase ATPase C chain